jgi:hypothetical protein
MQETNPPYFPHRLRHYIIDHVSYAFILKTGAVANTKFTKNFIINYLQLLKGLSHQIRSARK